jgi:hypothetical protein
MGFQNQSFIKRHSKSEEEALAIMSQLQHKGVFSKFVKTDIEQDKSGTDYLISMSDENCDIPVQFKIRREKWRDLPVCRFQPFRGFTRCTIGRDFKSLSEGKNRFYYVASSKDAKNFDRITITSTDKIFNLIQEAEREWFGDEESWSYFSEEQYQTFIKKRVYNKKLKTAKNGVEAWFKKNFDDIEGFGKINIYIPEKYADTIIDLII